MESVDKFTGGGPGTVVGIDEVETSTLGTLQ